MKIEKEIKLTELEWSFVCNALDESTSVSFREDDDINFSKRETYYKIKKKIKNQLSEQS